MPDPAAPEYANDVKAHMSYWTEVMVGQIANHKICYVEPEHGPWPYQQSMPNTQTKPTHDIWESNKHMAKLVKD